MRTAADPTARPEADIHGSIHRIGSGAKEDHGDDPAFEASGRRYRHALVLVVPELDARSVHGSVEARHCLLGTAAVGMGVLELRPVRR